MAERLSFSKKAAHFDGDIHSSIYNGSYNGGALKCTFVRGVPLASDLDSKNMIARGSDFSYRESYQILPVIEWNTRFVQEIVLGQMDLGSFDVRAVFSARFNDQMPHVKTIAYERDFTIIEEEAEDEANSGLVLNAFYGGLFQTRGHSWSPQGLAVDTISGVYRYRLAGKEYKLKNPASLYFDAVHEVDLSAPVRVP